MASGTPLSRQRIRQDVNNMVDQMPAGAIICSEEIAKKLAGKRRNPTNMQISRMLWERDDTVRLARSVWQKVPA